MSGRNWNAARKRDLVRQRGFEPVNERWAPKARQAKPPTAKQLRFLRQLAARAGVDPPEVRTLIQASKAIDALKDADPPTRRQLQQITKLASELDVRVPAPSTRTDAHRDLEMLERWRLSRNELLRIDECEQ